MARRILAVFLCGILVGAAWSQEPKKDPRKEPGKGKKADADNKSVPLRALVFFRTEPRKLNAQAVTAALKLAFPDRTVGEGEKDDIRVAATDVSCFVQLRKEDLRLLINSFPKPYVADPGALADDVETRTGDKALAAAVRAHKAWVSVDILGPEKGKDERLAEYAVLSKVAARLHDEKCSVLYFTELQKIYSANAAVVTALKDGKALSLADDGAVNIEEDDAEMKAAVETARKTIGDFAKALEDGKGVSHALKYHFKQDQKSEHMWVSVQSVKDGIATGRLANVPNFLTNVKEGDIVKKPLKEAEDWLYVLDGKLVGGYSIKVLQDRQKKRNPPKE